MRELGAAVVLGVLLVTSACGGNGSRPSKSELSQALQKGADKALVGDGASKVSKKAADCIAEVLVDSRISTRALKAIINRNTTYVPTRSDTTAAIAVREKIVKCLPAGLDDGS